MHLGSYANSLQNISACTNTNCQNKTTLHQKSGFCAIPIIFRLPAGKSYRSIFLIFYCCYIFSIYSNAALHFDQLALNQLIYFFPGSDPMYFIFTFIKPPVMRSVKQNRKILSSDKVMWSIINQNVPAYHLFIMGDDDMFAIQKWEKL